jgi:hypothetical protein
VIPFIGYSVSIPTSNIDFTNEELSHFSRNIQWAISEIEDSIENDECSEATAYTRSLVVGNLRELLRIIMIKRVPSGGPYVRPT